MIMPLTRPASEFQLTRSPTLKLFIMVAQFGVRRESVFHQTDRVTTFDHAMEVMAVLIEPLGVCRTGSVVAIQRYFYVLKPDHCRPLKEFVVASKEAVGR